MDVNNTGSGPVSAPRPGARLRIIGSIIVALGLVWGGWIYWRSAPAQDLSGDVSTAATSKTMAHDIEMNSGKMGLFMDDLMQDFQDPGTQAATIVLVSILVASGCFYFAHLLDRGGDSDGPVV